MSPVPPKHRNRMSVGPVDWRDTKLARNLDAQGQQELILCSRRRLQKDEILFSQGAPDHRYFLLLSGLMRIQRHSLDGHYLTYDLLPAGSCFGELAALDNGIRTGSAVAAKACELIEIPQKTLMHWLETQPSFTKFLLMHLVNITRHNTERLARLSYSTASQRVAAAILDWAQISGNVADAEIPGQDEWAAMIDVSRETLTRNLAQLQKEGVINKDGRKIHVNDLQKLKELIHDDSLLSHN